MDYLQSTIGFFALLSLGAIFSENIKSINLKYVVSGVVIQLVLTILLTRVDFIGQFFSVLSDGVMVLKAANDYGTGFVFGYLADGAPGAPFDITNPSGTFIFAFGGLTLVILMSAISALLWHLKVIPVIVNALSLLFKKPLNVGGLIGLGATANVFLGQVEAPLLIRPYLASMTRHELLVIMTAGMSTVSGSIMIALVSMLAPQFPDINLIQHLVSASILSIPAAIMYANIMIPSSEVTNFDGNSVPKVYDSSMDAITRGTRDGLDICLNVGAILIAFIALVSLLNSLLGILGGWIGISDLSLQLILGFIFFPIVWLMGVPLSETLASAELLGLKTALNEFVAYGALANIEPGVLSDRSKLITLYALCGFANFSSVGILVSGIGAMAPERKNDLIKVSIKALIGATLASCMTGLVIGIF